MYRRTFVKAGGGAVGTGIIAGCTGGRDGGGGDSGDGGGNGGDGGGGSTAGNDDGSSGVDYPTDDLRSIVPFATGGGFDAYARLSAPYWEEYLGTEVVVENVTGGGGVIGTSQVYNAEPDGYTMTIYGPGQGLPPQIARDVGYDLREMSHLGFVTQTPGALVLVSENEVTWDEFVNNVNQYTFATSGVGNTAHIGMEIMAELTGEFSRDDLNYVHYGGTGEVLAGLERGEADAYFITAGDSGAKVVQAIDNARYFMVFATRDQFKWYLDEVGVEPDIWTPDLGSEGLKTMRNTIASVRRFFAGPPGVPEEVLSIQREAFQKLIENQDFQDETTEAARPIIEPGDHTAVESRIDEMYELLTSEPFVSILNESIN